MNVGAVTWADVPVAEHHLTVLRDSGISPEVALERGYRTITDPEDLALAPFSRGQVDLVRKGPALLIPVHSVDGGGPATVELRPDVPRLDNRTGGGEPKPRKYEFPARGRKVVDVPPRVRALLADPSIPLWITEGARKADAAASIGLAAISLAGVWAFRSTNVQGGRREMDDFERIAFNERDVYIAFDSDVVTKAPVRLAMTRLMGVVRRRGGRPHVVVLPAGPMGEKRGLDDLISAGAGLPELLRMVDTVAEDSDERGVPEKLRDFILDQYTLGQDTTGNGFAIPRGGPRLVRMLNTGRPSLELEAPALFSAAEPGQPVIPRNTVRDVMRHVEHECYQAEPSQLHLRTAPWPSEAEPTGLVLDLGDPAGRLVLAKATGWSIIDEPGDAAPLFRRTENLNRLPQPVRGGSLDELRELLNVTDATWPLVKGWVIGSAFGWFARPWLYNHGPQGSGKTDGALLAMSVLDPRPRIPPPPRQGDRSDPAAVAYSTYLVGYDNVSKISEEMSDWLCSVVTGTQEQRRTLHTTASVTTLDLMRSGALTGVDVRVIRPDLLERLVKVPFDRIAGDGKREHSKVMAAFHAAHPRILGALLDAVVQVFQQLPGITGPLDVPRMADYAAVLMAYDRATGEDLLGAYRATVTAALDEQGLDDPVGKVLWAFMGDKEQVKMSPTELLAELTKHRANLGLDLEGSYWPGNARALSTALTQLTASLEQRLAFRTGKSGDTRWVMITKIGVGRKPEPGDASKTVASHVASQTFPQVNPSLNPSRDTRDGSSGSNKEGESEVTSGSHNVDTSLNLPYTKVAQRRLRPTDDENATSPGEMGGTQNRDASVPPGEGPDNNDELRSSRGGKRKPRVAPPSVINRRKPRVVDSSPTGPSLTTAAAGSPTPVLGAALGVLPQPPQVPCEGCGATQEAVPPSDYWYACPVCHPATFGRTQ